APDLARVVADAAGGERGENAGCGPRKDRSAWRLRLRLEPSQPDGYAGGAGAYSGAIPISGQEGAFSHSYFGNALAEGGSLAGGEGRSAGFLKEHDRRGENYPGARNLRAAVSRGRPQR